jgi:hypothetical protein
MNDTFPMDTRAVLTAAQTLGISEYEIFCLAYQKWHGIAAAEAQLDRLFVRYLFDAQAPHWVRHFAQQVVTLKRAGTSAMPLLRDLQQDAHLKHGVLFG